MSWNPQIYNQFKDIRYQAFFDLMNLISDENLHQGVDIGCGTGEQTFLLSERFKNSTFLGIDSSEEMLSESKKYTSENLHFKRATLEEFAKSESSWDLIFSNAALQWSNNHRELFPQLISKLNSKGQFAVQMPLQKENTLNIILQDLVSEQPFANWLKGFRRDSPLLSIDEYAQMMFEGGLSDLNLFVKVYPLIAREAIDLYRFISGSALIPYMERLKPEEQDLLKAEFIKRIQEHFKVFPAIYSFKRILLYGKK